MRLGLINVMQMVVVSARVCTVMSDQQKSIVCDPFIAYAGYGIIHYHTGGRSQGLTNVYLNELVLDNLGAILGHFIVVTQP